MANRPAPVLVDARRVGLDRELRVIAVSHASRRLTTEAYLAEHARLLAALAALAADATPTPPGADVSEVVEVVREIGQTWREGPEEARAKLVSRIYQR